MVVPRRRHDFHSHVFYDRWLGCEGVGYLRVQWGKINEKNGKQANTHGRLRAFAWSVEPL